MGATPMRSALFVPATRPDRIAKALASGADGVIVDLEDAVAPGDKAHARENLRRFLQQEPRTRLCVRINAAGSAHHQPDVALCAHSGISAIMLPKAGAAAGIERVAATGKPVWPIIESARGVAELRALARARGVERLALGALDLMHDLDWVAEAPPVERALDHVRCELVLHSRAAGLAPPLDSVHAALDDEAGLSRAAARARALGFGGMLCIHPRQVKTVNAAFAPSQEELVWARRVLEAASSGEAVAVIDGQMVDAPVIARARRLLSRAQPDEMSGSVSRRQEES